MGRQDSRVFWQRKEECGPLLPGGSSACGPRRRSVDLYRTGLKIEDLTKMHEGKSQFRILVVEDEAKVARALRAGLEREKYEVVVAPTGEEGFSLVNAEEVDLPSSNL